LSELSESIAKLNELFIGMVNGPYILFMKADDPVRFKEICSEQRKIRVKIYWFPDDENKNTWYIQPVDSRLNFKLFFVLPKQLYNRLFSEKENTIERAITIKEKIFSTITIYRFENNIDNLIRLEYDSKELPKEMNE
jgi:hypothetical protein